MNLKSLKRIYSDKDSEIFIFNIEQNCSMLNNSIIPKEQLEKIKKYKEEIDRNKRILSRTFLFNYCQEKYNLDNFSFEYTNNQRPKFKYSNINFSISYSKDIVVVALSTTLRVGIDIEYIESSAVSNNVALEFMDTTQFLEFNNLIKEDRDTYFYKVWTSKESYLKVSGDGLYINPKTITNEIGEFLYFKNYIISFTKSLI